MWELFEAESVTHYNGALLKGLTRVMTAAVQLTPPIEVCYHSKKYTILKSANGDEYAALDQHSERTSGEKCAWSTAENHSKD